MLGITTVPILIIIFNTLIEVLPTTKHFIVETNVFLKYSSPMYMVSNLTISSGIAF